MSNKITDGSLVLQVRVPRELLERIRALVVEIDQTRGLRTTKSAVARMLMEQGLAAHEGECIPWVLTGSAPPVTKETGT